MGLAERKVKQRIGFDPRNLAWANDTDKFAYKRMAALGWSESKGIGRDLDGNPNHIAVARRLDNGGIGMGRLKKEGGEVSAGAGPARAGLDDVLKRLASASASPAPVSASPSSAPSEAEAGPSRASVRNKIASRQKHLNSKRLASQSPAALAEILGIPIDSIPASAAASPSPSPSSPAPASVEPSLSSAPDAEAVSKPEPEHKPEIRETTSTLSVADYFRLKLREKALARAAASGTATPADAALIDAAPIAVATAKVLGAVAWEGNRMTFEEQRTEIVDFGAADAAEAAVVEKIVDGQAGGKTRKGKGRETGSDEEGEADGQEAKEDKAARKEAKRLKKLAKEEKRLAKEAKRVKKAAKAQAAEDDKAGKSGDKDRKRKRGEDGERKENTRKE
ncbi:hypothetical protein Q5752_002188 [Cryptotrichosporon argae]